LGILRFIVECAQDSIHISTNHLYAYGIQIYPVRF